MEIGLGTAVRIQGTCDAPARPAILRVRLGVIEREVDGWLRRGHQLLWWALVPIPAGSPLGAQAISLIATSAGDSGHREARLGEIRLGPGPAPGSARPADETEPLIAICMATHEPRLEWLARQIDSIRAQEWSRWVCLISDDRSSEESFAGLERVVGDDPRFTISRSQSRLGFYENFERSLNLAPPEAEFVALVDQDDRWHPDKLRALHAELVANPGAGLAYSDMRIVSAEGEVISDTFWYLGTNACDDLASLMITNTVTGAASLFRRDLLDAALPFPPLQSDEQYHDHWLALCALARGEIAYLDRPTWDYTRHVDSVTLHSRSQWFAPPRGLREQARVHFLRWTRRLRLGPKPLGWRDFYFDRYLMIRQLAAVLELRFGLGIGERKRRQLRLLSELESSPRALAWLFGRTLRPLIGRSETLGRERVLAGSLLWRLAATSVRSPRTACPERAMRAESEGSGGSAAAREEDAP